MKERIYRSEDHHIRNDLIDPSALFVLRKLHEAGYTAYLVGGGVRDLLMRKKPKDFDISTSAKPEEIKALFQRNCILIGRRFRLAHIRLGKNVVEVSTFRAGDPMDEELIVQDNIWGTPEEDVMRRDFTINGLFYDPLDHKIIDYVGGFEDLQKHCLRSIGDPILRFKQDPVRMIRMQKFRARFGFEVDPLAIDALQICRNEITKSSPARILEEIFRMLESGASEPFFRLLVESKILEILFPHLNTYFHVEATGEAIFTYLKAADSMNRSSNYKTLDRSILTSALLFPILEHEIKKCEKTPHMGEILDLANDLIHRLLFEPNSHFPRKIRLRCHYILSIQYRLTPLDKKRRPRTRIVKQREFIFPLIFLKLRALIQPDYFKIYEHWKQLTKKEDAQHEKPR